MRLILGRLRAPLTFVHLGLGLTGLFVNNALIQGDLHIRHFTLLDILINIYN
uniref:Uncharacterized protein n=1 Tax=Anguilla anguilla TaxID=7936 RepID=A0A0E9UYE7_ANGAN